MSIFYRKENYREMLFLKNLHLGNCNKKLSMVLPSGFSKEEYVETFKDCFPHLWEDIVLFCDLRKDNYMRRKGKRTSYCPLLFARAVSSETCTATECKRHYGIRRRPGKNKKSAYQCRNKETETKERKIGEEFGICSRSNSSLRR